MKKSVNEDLIAASDALEHLTKLYGEEKLTLPEKVDAAARLNAVAKMIEKLDEGFKADFAKNLKGKEGTVLGETFKAERNWVPAERFDQKAFKEKEPNEYEAYLYDASTYRVTFKPR